MSSSSILFKLKDLKPYFVILTSFVFFSVYKECFFKLNYEWLTSNRIVYFLLTKYTLIYLILALFGPSYFSSDMYYEANKSIRFSDVGILFVKFAFIYLVLNKRVTMSITALLFLTFLVSGNRTSVIAFVSVLSLYYLLFGHVNRKVIYIISSPVLIFLAYYVVDARGLDFNYEHLREFFINRFDPFISEFSKFNNSDFVFGLGVGHPFYIPWFEYRGLNPYNHSIDNLYLTLFVKQGVFSIVTYIFIVYTCLKITGDRMLVFISLLYFALIGLTSSIIYQSSFVFLFVFMMLSNNNSRILK
ncbi:DUF6369 family protein [Photobacterium leiognathi]|uniref:DUF6369 family protein n=1 Tax=Photobacterium leiognathi TaxID=553611 RepID=UPI00387E9AA8